MLQRPAEEMPCSLRGQALARFAMRFYWLQAHGHRITPEMNFMQYSPAKFAASHGSTEEAIEEWRQHWLHTPEGRLYGSNSEGAGVDRWAPQNLCTSAPTRCLNTIHVSASCCVGPWLKVCLRAHLAIALHIASSVHHRTPALPSLGKHDVMCMLAGVHVTIVCSCTMRLIIDR